MSLAISVKPEYLSTNAAFEVLTTLTEGGAVNNLRIRAELYKEGVVKSIIEKPKGATDFDFQNVLNSAIRAMKISKGGTEKGYGGDDSPRPKLTVDSTHNQDDGGAYTWEGDPIISKSPTTGVILCVYRAGTNHLYNGYSDIVGIKSTNDGTSWTNLSGGAASSPTVILDVSSQHGATWDYNNFHGGYTPTGRFIIFGRAVKDGATAESDYYPFMDYSDNDGTSWNGEIDLETVLHGEFDTLACNNPIVWLDDGGIGIPVSAVSKFSTFPARASWYDGMFVSYDDGLHWTLRVVKDCGAGFSTTTGWYAAEPTIVKLSGSILLCVARDESATRSSGSLVVDDIYSVEGNPTTEYITHNGNNYYGGANFVAEATTFSIGAGSPTVYHRSSGFRQWISYDNGENWIYQGVIGWDEDNTEFPLLVTCYQENKRKATLKTFTRNEVDYVALLYGTVWASNDCDIIIAYAKIEDILSDGHMGWNMDLAQILYEAGSYKNMGYSDAVFLDDDILTVIHAWTYETATTASYIKIDLCSLMPNLLDDMDWLQQNSNWDTFTQSGDRLTAIESGGDAERAYIEIWLEAGSLYSFIWGDYDHNDHENPPLLQLTDTSFVNIHGERIMPTGTDNYGYAFLMPITTGLHRIALSVPNGYTSFAGDFFLYEINPNDVDFFAGYWIKFTEVYENLSGVTTTGSTISTAVFQYIKSTLTSLSDYIIGTSTSKLFSYWANIYDVLGIACYYYLPNGEIQIPFLCNTDVLDIDIGYKIDGAPSYTYVDVVCPFGMGLIIINSDWAAGTSIEIEMRIGGATTASAKYSFYPDTECENSGRIVLEWYDKFGSLSYFAFEGDYEKSFETERGYYLDSNKNKKILNIDTFRAMTLYTRFELTETLEYLERLLKSEEVYINNDSEDLSVTVVSKRIRTKRQGRLMDAEIDIELEE